MSGTIPTYDQDSQQQEPFSQGQGHRPHQQAPQPAAPAVAPAPPLTVFVETRSEEEVVASAPAGVMPAVAPFVASAPAAPAATTSAVVTEPSAIELLAEEAPVCEPTAPPSFAEEPSTTEPLATEWYGIVRPPWIGDSLQDSLNGGQVAWGLGEIPNLIVLIAIAVQWSRSDARDAKRHDRQADRDDDAELRAYNERLASLHRQDRP